VGDRSCDARSGERDCGDAELAIGAEFLAAISQTVAERIEHLKMAGIYWVRAREAGGPVGAALLN
jgi:hypothetical protein